MQSTQTPTLLNIDGAHALLNAMRGDGCKPLTRRQVQRAFTERRLPVFRDKVTGELMITENELVMCYRGKQIDAINAMKQRDRESH